MFNVTDSEIQDLVDGIAKRFSPEKIILFGSRATEKHRDDSDVDLLVVMRFEGRAFRKALEILSVLDFRKPLDLVLKTPEELALRYQAGDPLIREAMDSGRVLYDKPGY